ncbi:MAG: hypothetical protein JW720_08670 [Sedimentisphaerales bacterium]|nr:hypothetical protein [Sedimentisphaerales bacterium]
MKDLIARMAREGYDLGLPGGMEISDHAIEAELCTNSICEKCGRNGLEYVTFVDHTSQDFRAFSYCPDCANAEEL